jgi:hypothetical protein
LKTLRGYCDQFVPMAQDVWGRMDAGGFSTAMRRKLKHFNGGLFQESHALPVTPAQLELLIQAGENAGDTPAYRWRPVAKSFLVRYNRTRVSRLNREGRW